MADEPDALTGFGRFVEPAFLILVSLSDGPRHGYAMLDDIEDISTIRFGAGTLYGAIARLEQQGLIEGLPASDRRRPYQLTERGANVVRAHLMQLQHLAIVGLQRLAVS